MDLQSIVNALLLHLTETTIERDQARAENARLRKELAEATAAGPVGTAAIRSEDTLTSVTGTPQRPGT